MNGKRVLGLSLTVMAVAAMGWPASRAWQEGKRSDPFEETWKPFFRENCAGCHNGKQAAGGLNLEEYQNGASVLAHRETWESVWQRLLAGEMPPKGAPRPNPAEVKAVTGWLEGEFARADRAMRPNAGRVTARRLNRAEYDNTIRDLLGVDLGLAEEFPQDDSGYGFDTIGDVLSLPPVLMEKYLVAAERAAEAAIYGPEVRKPSLFRLPSPNRNIVPEREPRHEYDRSGLTLPNALHLTWRFPVEAEYLWRIFLGGERPAASDPIELVLWIDGVEVQTARFDAEDKASFEDDHQDFGAMMLELRQRVPAGKHWIAISIRNLYEGLPASYGGPNPARRPPRVVPPFRTPPQVTPERAAELKRQYEARWARKRPVNLARVGRLEIGGPYEARRGPSATSLEAVYSCGHTRQGAAGHGVLCERKILGELARRAWRRPVTGAELARLRAVAAQTRARGGSFEEGLSVAIQALLVSPHFLFRIEQDRGAGREGADLPLSDHEVATRLSYFLWSSLPDARLRRLADEGRLNRPVVLEAEVRRMLRDPKARALIENFAGQWLELRKLESIKPDTKRFPAFDEYLRLSMREETETFLAAILREDRPVTELIGADYSYLNERLAAFYGIEGITGPAFRRVVFGPDARRGGLLTQASFLTVSSYSTRTSPVLRGKWILENILHTPPPPPPPGVPALDEEAGGSAATIRQRLEEHRRNPTCASCHARMDPLGFGLENFDAVGRWRTRDGEASIDATGTLPDGRSFEGPDALRKIILAEREAFVTGLAEKLLTYALGRGLERTDRPIVRSIARRTLAQGDRPTVLIAEIVRSLPFRYRRVEGSQPQQTARREP